MVKHHVKEEETKIFGLIREHSDETTQNRLCQDFLAEKRDIQLNVGQDEVIASAGNDSELGSSGQMPAH